MYEVRHEILEVARALGEETRFSIFQRIANAPEPLTVKDLVEQLGMHHSAIRIHLNKLEDAGLIFSRKRHTPGVVGRPQLVFLPKEEAVSISLPPRSYEFLARLTVDMLAANGSAESPEAFARKWGRGYMRGRGRLIDGRLPLPEAVTVLVEELQRLGSSGRVGTLEDGFRLSDTNCLFAEVAPARESLVCRLHQAAMRGMLEELSVDRFEWQQTKRICDGDDECAMHISPAEFA